MSEIQADAAERNGDGKASPTVAESKALIDKAVGAILFPVPLDDPALFTKLASVAEECGRPEIAEEFRRRAQRLPVAPAGTNGTAVNEERKGRPLVTKSLIKEGVRLINERKFLEAVETLREATRKEDNKHDAYSNLGVALAELKRLAEAEAAFREAVRFKPQIAGTHANLGMACFHQGKFKEAEEPLRQAVGLEPNNAAFLLHLGGALEALNRIQEAEAAYRAALAAQPGNPDCHFRLGKALERLKKPADAEKCFRAATQLKSNHADFWAALGGVLEAQGQSRAAADAFDVAVKLQPKNPEFVNNLGIILANLYQYAEAEAAYRRALQIDPKSAMVHSNLGNCLRSQGRLDEAITILLEAIRLRPNYPEAHNNLGIAYVQKRLTTEAAACYEEALRLRPNYPEAHLNRSFLWLSGGDFQRGWAEYEWRFKLKNRQVPGKAPQWDGKPLDGRRLLLHCEQGLGDAVQFMRYAALIPRGSGGTIAIECPEALVELARTCPGIDHVVKQGQKADGFDISFPVMSVARILGTNLSNIPGGKKGGVQKGTGTFSAGITDSCQSEALGGGKGARPLLDGTVPYFRPDPARVAHWRAELDLIPGRKIGISWQGNRDHKMDRLRSLPLAAFAPLAKARGVSLCSIQKGFGTEQLTDGTADGVPVRDFGSLASASYADTAALIKALDLVVTVDTSIAHVAGAIGAPVWVMVQYAADWRWLTERSDTPWYPTMRLFRQTTLGDWAGVFARIVSAVEQWPDRLRSAAKS